MAKKPPLELGNLSQVEDRPFRDSLQEIIDNIFEDAHDEPVAHEFRVTRKTVQSIPNNINTKVLFPIIEFDDEGNFNSDLGRYTVIEDGTYFMSAQIELPATPTSTRLILTIKKNGVEELKGSDGPISSLVTGIIKVVVGDYLEVFLEHNSSGAEDTTLNPARVKFSGYKIAGGN